MDFPAEDIAKEDECILRVILWTNWDNLSQERGECNRVDFAECEKTLSFNMSLTKPLIDNNVIMPLFFLSMLSDLLVMCVDIKREYIIRVINMHLY